MRKGDRQDLRTVYVTGSSAVAAGDGQAAIVLETNVGPIAFAVDEEAIQALRKNLAAAEQFLRQKIGRA